MDIDLKDLPWRAMSEEKPNKEWILFIPKIEGCATDRGYAFPEENCVLFPWGRLDFDNIEYWLDLTTIRAIEEWD